MQYATEGHGFNRDEGVFDFYQRVDRFLSKHLQGGAAAAKSVAAPGK